MGKTREEIESEADIIFKEYQIMPNKLKKLDGIDGFLDNLFVFNLEVSNIVKYSRRKYGKKLQFFYLMLLQGN